MDRIRRKEKEAETINIRETLEEEEVLDLKGEKRRSNFSVRYMYGSPFLTEFFFNDNFKRKERIFAMRTAKIDKCDKYMGFYKHTMKFSYNYIF